MSTDRVAPFDALVNRLRSESGRFVPHVSPKHGGVEAPVLSVLQDPGPATHKTGLLDTGNPDATSRRQRELMTAVGLSQSHMTPWNAYPWSREKSEAPLTPELVAEGAVVLVEAIGMMCDLRVLLLQGKQAGWAWAMARAFTPRFLQPSFVIVSTSHPRAPHGNKVMEAQQLEDWRRVSAVALGTEGLN